MVNVIVLYFWTQIFAATLNRYSKAWYIHVLPDVVFCLAVCGRMIISRKNITGFSKTGILLILFFVSTVIWSLINENQVLAILLSLRSYKNIFLFLMIPSLTYAGVNRIMNHMKIAAIVSVPVAIIQRLISTNVTGDDVCGLFGVSGTLSIIMISYVAMEYSKRLRNDNNVFGWYWILLIPILINETKISYIYLPMMLIFVIYLVRAANMRVLIATIALLISSLSVVSYVYKYAYSSSIDAFFTEKTLNTYLNTDWEEDQGRFLKLKLIYNNISEFDNPKKYFGGGIGSSFIGKGSDTMGTEAIRLHSSRALYGTQMQINTYLTDFGLIGTSIMLLWSVYCIFTSVNMARRYNDSIHVFGTLLVTMLGFSVLYTPTVTDGVMSVYAFLAYYIGHRNPMYYGDSRSGLYVR